MTPRPRLLVVVAALMLARSPASAQVMAGRVADRATRLPARSVEVRVLGDSGAVVARTTTDTSGLFQVGLPGPGRVRLEFGIVGLSPYRSDTMSVRADDFIAKEYLIELPRVHTELEVEKQVSVVPGTFRPRYPEGLKQLGVEGEVLASFVVDTTGLAIVETFRAIRSTDNAFSAAVRNALRDARFVPAEVRGRKVRQLVQQPFNFALDRSRPATSPGRDDAFPPPPKAPYPGRP